MPSKTSLRAVTASHLPLGRVDDASRPRHLSLVRTRVQTPAERDCAPLAPGSARCFASEFAMRVAEVYRVDMHAMLVTGPEGSAGAYARAMLIGALVARGWQVSVVERWYGLRPGEGARGIRLWRRIRGGKSFLTKVNSVVCDTW